MDKNTIIGLLLIGIVFFGYIWWSQPSQEQLAEYARQDSIEMVKLQQEQSVKKLQAQKAQEALKKAEEDSTQLFYAALSGTEQKVVLSNSKVALTLNTKGATVEKAVIKDFKDRKGNKHLTLFNADTQRLNFTFPTKTANISTENLFFDATNVTDSTVTFTANAGEGKSIVLNYKLGKNYLLSMQMYIKGMSGLFAPNTTNMNVDWSEMCSQQEKGHSFENRYATLTYHKVAGGTKHLSETTEKIDKAIEEKIDWVAFKNQFFSAVMIAKNDFAENSVMTSIPQDKQSNYLKKYDAKLKTAFDPTGTQPSEFEFFYGPNEFRLLQRVEKESSFNKDLQMERLVYLGWPLFRIINRWFTIYVFSFLTSLNIPMGIVLILITLLLKVITYPMVKKSYLSSAKMRVLKPKLDAATKQYDGPEQQMQKQQAMMQEYAKYGVSPMAGCLPALIQMPIWIAMFNFVPNAIELRGQSFLWISDLSTYDPIIEWGKHIWLIGDHLSLTCILFCVGQLAYSWMTMKQQKDQMVGQQAEQMKMMQWMMMLMPLMFFFIFNDYSAGLNFYYFVSLALSAIIMWALRRFTDEEKLLARLEAKYKENKDSGKKLSGLAGRLQAMQEEQMRMEAKRKELERKRRGL
jgi:YidC/Oxa1 family membrane protein insertase